MLVSLVEMCACICKGAEETLGAAGLLLVFCMVFSGVTAQCAAADHPPTIAPPRSRVCHRKTAAVTARIPSVSVLARIHAVLSSCRYQNMPGFLKWTFWCNPLTYVVAAVLDNE